MTEDRSNPSLLSELTDSFRGRARDYTSGSLWRAIMVLSVPMVLEMLMQSVFEVVDIFFVGRLGADAVASVGLTASLIIIVFAVGLGLSLAASAMVSRRIGEKDADGAASAAWQAILLTLGVAVPVGLLAAYHAPTLLELMGGSESVVDIGTGYAQWTLGANVTVLLLFLFNAVFRGAGDAGTAMKALWLANILNIMLDPLFIFGWGPVPAFGTTGAAIATTIGRSVGVAYQIRVLWTGRTRVHLQRRHMHLDPSVMRRIFRISGPGMVQYLVGTASWLALMRIMAGFGSEALAGYTVSIRVIVFALLPSWGISNAAATMVGQNLGARRPERAEKAVWNCVMVNVGFLVATGLVFWLNAESIVRIFIQDEEAVTIGVQSIRIICATYPAWAVGMVTIQSFNGAGDTRTPTWLNFLAYWVLQLPLAWGLAHMAGLGPRGIFIAIVVAQVVGAVAAAWVFRMGRWKEVVV